MKFSIKDFFSKCAQIRNFLRIWLHLPKKSLTLIWVEGKTRPSLQIMGKTQTRVFRISEFLVNPL